MTLLHVVYGKFAALLWHFDTAFSNRKNELTEQMRHAAMDVTDYSGDVCIDTK